MRTHSAITPDSADEGAGQQATSQLVDPDFQRVSRGMDPPKHRVHSPAIFTNTLLFARALTAE